MELRARDSERQRSSSLRLDSRKAGPAGPSLELLTAVEFVDSELQMLGNAQHYDSQTGLPNFESFRKLLGILLQDGADDGEVAVIWIDLLNLRREFSLHGWTGAESLVRRVANALRSSADDKTLFCRFSGRCFVVAMQAGKLARRDRRRIQAIVEALKNAHPSFQQAEPQIAAGVAFYPADTRSAEDLVRFASLAATRASYLKSHAAIPFHSSMNSLIMQDHQVEVEMEYGLERGQFTTVYQPKIGLLDGSILGVEALTRWNHPAWGPVTPGEFIPVAERCGFIHRIFESTMRNALRDARMWCKQGYLLPIVTVNVSANSLRRRDFAGTVRRMLREWQIEPTRLEFEITESVMFDDEELFASRVRQLKQIGVRVAIDDFGTRYTGFNQLRQLPLDVMKIDRCFVHGVGRCRDTLSLCHTIVAMARRLGMRTVAEGIEEPEELEALRRIECEAGQGYLFQRPVPAAELETFLREWPGRMAGFGFEMAGEAKETHGLARSV